MATLSKIGIIRDGSSGICADKQLSKYDFQSPQIFLECGNIADFVRQSYKLPVWEVAVQINQSQLIELNNLGLIILDNLFTNLRGHTVEKWFIVFCELIKVLMFLGLSLSYDYLHLCSIYIIFSAFVSHFIHHVPAFPGLTQSRGRHLSNTSKFHSLILDQIYVQIGLNHLIFAWIYLNYLSTRTSASLVNMHFTFPRPYFRSGIINGYTWFVFCLCCSDTCPQT